MGKRAIYGLIAVTFVLIGVATLALQFSARQTSRTTTASMPAAAAVIPKITPSAAAVVVAPVVAVPTVVTPPIVAPTAATAPAAASAARAYLAPPANDAERQARCIEILQKASLEQITPAETSFFKKECK